MAEAAATPGPMQVGIVVRDLEAMTPFYRDAIGLPHVTDLTVPFGRMRMFSCGDGRLKLLQLNDAPDKDNPPDGIYGASTGLRWVTVAVTDIEKVIERCEALGGTASQPLVEFQPGKFVAIVEDPEASCWVELVENRG
jgi:predicted enzyme related to lactoylglutathione lyase